MYLEPFSINLNLFNVFTLNVTGIALGLTFITDSIDFINNQLLNWPRWSEQAFPKFISVCEFAVHPIGVQSKITINWLLLTCN